MHRSALERLRHCHKTMLLAKAKLLRVNVSKNQGKFKKRGHGQKSIALILCQFEGLGK